MENALETLRSLDGDQVEGHVYKSDENLKQSIAPLNEALESLKAIGI